ncbi:MAG: ATP-binding protein [Candidatus Woesearchaeota archaeon]|nr:ATP-binding protein [Candidatus Woesearchaeota archaeon]
MQTLTETLKKIFIENKDPFTDILGQEAVKKQIKSALLMDRHIIIVGPPGIGKTTLAKNISKLLPVIEINDCGFSCTKDTPLCPKCKAGDKTKTKKIKGEDRFIRIQGSPDLTAEDLLGDIDPIKALKFGPLSIEAFTPGKIFKANNGILFFDEVNRCPEKLQNALLQVLSEKKATIGSYDVDFPADFIFIGTMNPEDASTEKLSDVFVDRFDFVYMSYPENLEIETRIVKEKGKSLVEFPEELLELVIRFVRILRESEKLEKHPSVRASIGLYERAQSNAFLAKKKKVDFDDVKEAVVSVLSHRIELKPSVKYLQSPKEYIEEQFSSFSDRNLEEIEKGGYR